jgi:hypothetical protein
MNIQKTLAKVRRLLKRVHTRHEVPDSKSTRVSRIVFHHGRNEFVATTTRNGPILTNIAGIDGYVDGYNTYVTTLAYYLADLRLLTAKEAEMFSEWFYKRLRTIDEERALESLLTEAGRRGYVIRKAKE